MTIKKGEIWGEPGPLPTDGVLIHSDAEAHQIINNARAKGEPVPTLGLVGGDLARAMGATQNTSRLYSNAAVTRPVDVVKATFGGEEHWFISHMIAKRRGWQGQFVCAMNAEFFGKLKLAPRAHPNDGLVDVLIGTLSFDDRLKALKKAETGEHVPHPGLSIKRTRSHTVEFQRPTPIVLDGVSYGKAKQVQLEVEPDAVICVV